MILLGENRGTCIAGLTTRPIVQTKLNSCLLHESLECATVLHVQIDTHEFVRRSNLTSQPHIVLGEPCRFHIKRNTKTNTL